MQSEFFRKVTDFILVEIERGYVDNPKDPGRLTVFGIASAYTNNRPVVNEVIHRLKEIDNNVEKAAEEVLYALARPGDVSPELAEKVQSVMEVVYDFYYNNYWKPFSRLCADGDTEEARIQNTPLIFAYDTAINHGRAKGAKFIQVFVNEICGKRLVVDGIIGPMTAKAYHSCMKSSPDNLLAELAALRMLQYARIGSPHKKHFLRGWYHRVRKVIRGAANYMETGSLL